MTTAVTGTAVTSTATQARPVPGHDIVVSTAVRTVGPESGVLALALHGSDVARTHVEVCRSGGPALDVLAAMHGMRHAGLAATVPARIEVRTTQAVASAIAAHLSQGSIQIPEAGPLMYAVARIHGSLSAAGHCVQFVATPSVLPETLYEELARTVDRAQRHHDKLAAAEWKLPAADAEWVSRHNATVVYTDGAHHSETGFGAWAWWVDETRFAAGTMAAQTSTMIERLALYKALRAFDGPVLAVTDFDASLPRGRGRTQHGSHARLLRKLRLELGRGNVRVLNVKGHHRCAGNRAVDALAGTTAKTQWAQLCEEPAVAVKLIELYQQRRDQAEVLRAQAGIRGERRRAALPARRAKGSTTKDRSSAT